MYRILLRKKSKELGRYDLCYVVNARYFPDKENPDRSYIRLIVIMNASSYDQIQWDHLKQDYLYIFRSANHEKGSNLYQLIEWFNMILPLTVYTDTEVRFGVVIHDRSLILMKSHLKQNLELRRF